jgi:hypothetical protein
VRDVQVDPAIADGLARLGVWRRKCGRPLNVTRRPFDVHQTFGADAAIPL